MLKSDYSCRNTILAQVAHGNMHKERIFQMKKRAQQSEQYNLPEQYWNH